MKDKKLICTSIILVILVILIISIFCRIFNFFEDIIYDYGIENLSQSLVALYQVRTNDRDIVEIKENVYLVKNKEIAFNMSSNKEIEKVEEGVLSPAVFKICINRNLYSFVEFSYGSI